MDMSLKTLYQFLVPWINITCTTRSYNVQKHSIVIYNRLVVIPSKVIQLKFHLESYIAIVEPQGHAASRFSYNKVLGLGWVTYLRAKDWSSYQLADLVSVK